MRRLHCIHTRYLGLLLGGLLLWPAASLATPQSTLTDLPLPAQATIAAALGQDQPAYHATSHGRTVHVTNPRHGLTATFTRTGLTLTLTQAQTTTTLQLIGYGYGTPAQLVRPAPPRAAHHRIEYRRGPLTEWYVNSPMGLEQGFTLQTPPRGRRTGPLTLAMRVGGEVTAQVAADQRTATLQSRTGTPLLTYTGLTVLDATGAALPAWLQADGSSLRIQVDDTRARYPLTIDPFIQAKLTASDGAASDFFGSSVAISGDTVVVGAPGSDNGGYTDQGAAYVFVKPGSGWSSMTQVAKLTTSYLEEFDAFGTSVAISGDTIVVGARHVHVYGSVLPTGAAHVFVKPVTGWANMTQTATLFDSHGIGGDAFGASVAISGDTIVVGAPGVDNGANADQGAAYVFVKPATGWTGIWSVMSQDAKLTTSYSVASAAFGRSVAISGDMIVVGARYILDCVFPNPSCFPLPEFGGVLVFVKPATGWAGVRSQDAKLTTSYSAASDAFGRSVAISGDMIVVGARHFPDTESLRPTGAAHVFVKPATGWADMIQTATLSASDMVMGDAFGTSVAISGGTIVVGAPDADIGANTDQGAAYVFTGPTLTVTKAGTGSGTVTSTPAGIDCGTDCSESYTNGTSVTLTAIAEFGSAFAGWSGHCTGTTNPITVTMNGDKSCTATFSRSGVPPGPPRSLTVTKAGTGSGTVTSTPAGIDCGADCSESYTNGITVTLTALATFGSTFDGWSGDCAGTANPTTVTMNGDKSCTATFTSTLPTPHVALQVSGAGPGSLLSNPITVTFTLQGCSGQEMFLVLNASAMGIPWSYLSATGGWVPLPATRAAITPYGSGPPDGTYTLYTGTVPSGSYELYLGCDFVVDGHLTLGPLNIPNGISDHVSVFVP